MKRATCTHFIDKRFNAVLLGYQQAKIIGRKGYGGKIETHQTALTNAVDEVWDETGGNKEKRLNPNTEGGITFNPKDLIPVALIDFYNGTEEEVPFGNPSFRVIFFNCYKFSGTAVDTVEMQDSWFYLIDNLPDDLVPGDERFLKDILEGKLTKGWMRRTANLQTVIDSHFEPANIDDLVI